MLYQLSYEFNVISQLKQAINLKTDIKKEATNFDSLFFSVIPLGLEPRTPTLKVLCSTN
jgi:hypothetical protein